jgi:integrase
VERHHDQSLARLAEHQNHSAPDRWLSREEKLKLFLAFKSPWYLLPICLIALYTGLRKGNVVDLYWREIDFERRTITKTRTKSNDNLVIPLNKTVITVLEQLPRIDERVFPGSQKMPSQRSLSNCPRTRPSRAANESLIASSFFLPKAAVSLRRPS